MVLHGPDQVLRKQPGAVRGQAAVEMKSGEAEEIAHPSEGPRASRRVRERYPAVCSRLQTPGLGIPRMPDGGAVPNHVIGERYGRRSPQRPQQHRIERLMPWQTRNLLDDAPGHHETRVGIRPHLTWRVNQADVVEPGHEFLYGVVPAARVEEAVAFDAAGAGPTRKDGGVVE